MTSGFVGWSAELQGTMGPSGVVVLVVLGEDVPQVLLVVDQQPVGALGSDRAYEPLGVGVHPRRLRRALQDLDVVGGEDGVQGLGIAGVAVAQQVAEGGGALAEVVRRFRAMGGPVRGGVGGDAEDVNGAGADFHDVEHVQPLQGHGVDVEEVGSEQAGGLGA
jgi:hypothetical protein